MAKNKFLKMLKENAVGGLVGAGVAVGSFYYLQHFTGTTGPIDWAVQPLLWISAPIFNFITSINLSSHISLGVEMLVITSIYYLTGAFIQSFVGKKK